MSKDISIPPIREDGLQLHEERDLQSLFWTVQRLSWFLICLVALFAFTGSGGLFQKQTIRFAEAIVELPRDTRWEATDEIVSRFTEAAETRDVTIGQVFFDLFSIDRIQPEPRESALAPAAQRLRSAAEGTPPQQVTLAIRSGHFGLPRFDVMIGGESRRASILVLP